MQYVRDYQFFPLDISEFLLFFYSMHIREMYEIWYMKCSTLRIKEFIKLMLKIQNICSCGILIVVTSCCEKFNKRKYKKDLYNNVAHAKD